MRTDLQEDRNFTYKREKDFWSFLTSDEIKEKILVYLNAQDHEDLLDYLIYETDFSTFAEIKKDKELELKWLRSELEVAESDESNKLPSDYPKFYLQVKSDIESLKSRIKCLEEN